MLNVHNFNSNAQCSKFWFKYSTFKILAYLQHFGYYVPILWLYHLISWVKFTSSWWHSRVCLLGSLVGDERTFRPLVLQLRRHRNSERWLDEWVQPHLLLFIYFLHIPLPQFGHLRHTHQDEGNLRLISAWNRLTAARNLSRLVESMPCSRKAIEGTALATTKQTWEDS